MVNYQVCTRYTVQYTRAYYARVVVGCGTHIDMDGMHGWGTVRFGCNSIPFHQKYITYTYLGLQSFVSTLLTAAVVYLQQQ